MRMEEPMSEINKDAVLTGNPLSQRALSVRARVGRLNTLIDLSLY